MSETTDIIQKIKERRKDTGDTLEDLGDRDLDNFDHVLKRECKVHYFSDIAECGRFMGFCLIAGLRRTGVDLDRIVGKRLKDKVPGKLYSDILENQAPKFLDKELESEGLRIERRRYEDVEDSWKNGLYVFKNNELACFIGDSERNVTAPHFMRYSCRTNVPVQDDRKIFSMPSLPVLARAAG